LFTSLQDVDYGCSGGVLYQGQEIFCPCDGQTTNICNSSPEWLRVARHRDHPSWAVPFHHSANLFNMPQTGMFRLEDCTFQIPTCDCTLSGSPLAPELVEEDSSILPQIATPWSGNETPIMHLLLPSSDSLCLNFGRTAVFQWNEPNSSTLYKTTEWPQRIAGDGAGRSNVGGITHRKRESQPQLPYVIFRNMRPNLDCYYNSRIPCIKGLTHRFHESTTNTKTYAPDLQSLQLFHFLPHLQCKDVSNGLEPRVKDLQTLARAIFNRTGQSSLSNPQHSTTRRLLHLDDESLQYEKRRFCITADLVINILCKTDSPNTSEMDRLQTPPMTDYLGHSIGQPGNNGMDTWGHLNKSETGWGNWFGIIACVCKTWNTAAQCRRNNPSHITIHDWHSVVEKWESYRGRILREITASAASYTMLHSLYVGHGAIQNKPQAHELINLLCDLVPTLKKLHMPDTTAEIGL